MIYPIILCGGSGTRLWPLSRKSYPKQFSKLIGDLTLFQMTCMRLKDGNFLEPTIVTNERFRFTVLDELSDIDITARRIILEPVARNTAPAILAAVIDIAEADPEALVLVLPSDHSITNLDVFKDALDMAEREMLPDQIITFGIKPERAETGYGYLELNGEYGLNEIQKLTQFVEKPGIEHAKAMLTSGRFLWNSGIFFARVAHFVELYERHQSEIYTSVKKALRLSTQDMRFTRPDETSWDAAPNLSIDYAIMEKADKLAVIPLDMGWSDLGDWKAVWSATSQDQNGVALAGSAHAIECTDSLLRSETEGITVVGIGLDNIFAVAMGDAVVVGDMDRAQDVRRAVSILENLDIRQAGEFPRDHRPWGWYETLALGSRFRVKRIVVKPGAALSLQSHTHRSEHWTVVEGTARVTVDEDVKLLGENMSVYVPLGSVHRMENPGKIPLTLIEVQSGSYLEEDDIIRYEDQFGRR